MKKLMKEKPFAKISVIDICEGCGMNRKSFYYHFKDKYDLVNWNFLYGFYFAGECRQFLRTAGSFWWQWESFFTATSSFTEVP